MIKPKITTLKNGLRIVTVPMKDNPTVTVLIMVEVGSRNETRTTNGLSHFLEHMCFKGTVKRKSLDISYELEAMGAETNAFTGYDYTGYYAKGRANLFPKLLDVVADVYQNSIFPEAEIEKERGVICGEIDMYEDMSHRKVQDLIAISLYGDQPAGYSIAGTKENVRRFTREDFLKYRNTHYVAGKTSIIVAGGIDDSVVAEVKKAFKDIRIGKVSVKKKVSSARGDRIIAESRKTDQSHIVLGTRSIAAEHPDMPALMVAIGILGQGMSSRLFNKLREEMGAGYYIRSGISASDDSGEITISTGTEPSRVTEVIAAIVSEIRRMRTEKVTHNELAKQKEYMIGGMLMGLETSDAVASHFAQNVVLRLKLKTPQELEKEIRGVTEDDILRVSKKYLKQDLFRLALVGPETPLVEIEKVLC
jgi:predicted Zn-dependent peptidase